jgi:hypothetical protein
MKSLTFIITFLVLTALGASAQPVMSATFGYDAAGNRVQRFYQLVMYKTANPETPVDTLDGYYSEDHVSNSNIVVRSYPNPVSTDLIIENMNWEDKNRVEVKFYDINGKLVLSQPMNQAKGNISFRNVANGTYQVHYYLNNRLLTTWKVVKL